MSLWSQASEKKQEKAKKNPPPPGPALNALAPEKINLTEIFTPRPALWQGDAID